MIKRVVLFLAIILFVTSIASASFQIGNKSHDIQTNYGQGSTLKGWINISFSNESLGSVFSTNTQKSITVKKILGLNEDYDYDCSPIDCNSDYEANNGQETKSININSGETKTVGIKLTGSISYIDFVKLNVQSNAQASCTNQLKIDFSSDDSIEIGNAAYSESLCSSSKRYGCFDSSKETEDLIISTTPYCQRINLTESPGFNVGAYVKTTTPGNKVIKMQIYDLTGDLIDNGECQLSVSGNGEFSCNINQLITREESYYVCIAGNDGTGTYKVVSNSNPVNKCGFYGFPGSGKSEVASYNIFAQGKQFAPVGNIQVNDELANGERLSYVVRDFIQARYGSGMDCSDGCVVPLKISSGASQTLTLSNLQVQYERAGVGLVVENKFYDLTEKEARINSNFQKINIDDANFSVPDGLGNKTITLELDNDEIFSEKINIKKFPSINDISPMSAAAGVPTEFTISLSENYTITSYEWSFINDKNYTTSVNKVTHSFNSTGNKTLTVTIKDSSEFSSSKTFDINVESPKVIANITLNEKLSDLAHVKSQIANLSVFYQNAINKIINISNEEEDIKNVQRDYISASSDEEYISVMQKILQLNIPKEIVKTETSNQVNFVPKRDKIDLDVVKTVTISEYESSKESEYVNGIYSWNLENIESKIKYEELTAIYETESKALARFFVLTTSENTPLSYDVYLFIEKMNGLSFKSDYTQRESGNYYYITLSGSKTIEFYTFEDVDFKDVSMFISPSLSRISLTSTPPVIDEEEFPWKIYLIILGILLVIAVIIYVYINTKYKSRYEYYLFKNRNDLYNILGYINNARAKGTEDSKIKESLKKSGWSSEQINYAMNKHSGKKA